jgi:hypothetical protein
VVDVGFTESVVVVAGGDPYVMVNELLVKLPGYAMTFPTSSVISTGIEEMGDEVPTLISGLLN